MSKSLAEKVAELSVAVPQVVAHRLARMALAGPVVSARDWQELERMVTEKQFAFAEAWFAMAISSLQAYQTFTAWFFLSLWSPPGQGSLTPVEIAQRLGGSALEVTEQAIAPVHRKAVANAKRLGRSRLR